MNRWGRAVVLLAVLTVLASAVALALALRQAEDGGGRGQSTDLVQQFPPEERRVLGDFSVELLDGRRFDQSDLIGTVSVVNVWGSWCGPCRTEAPDLVRVARRLGDRVNFLGINVRDNPASAQAFERSFEIPYPSVHPDDAGTAILAFDGALTAAAVPSTVVLDEQGRVAARVVGPVDAATLRGLVLDALGAPS